MPDDEIIWPMGMTDRGLSERPMVFRPQGFLVAIVTDADEAYRAVDALRTAGFADLRMRVKVAEDSVYSRFNDLNSDDRFDITCEPRTSSHILGPRACLSKGQRKRGLLALGLLTPQPVLLIDEPLDGLDLRQMRDVAEVLRRRSKNFHPKKLTHFSQRFCPRLT